MISYLLLAFIKVIDNLIGTAKNILVYKEEKVLSSILVVASQLIFYLVIDQVISDNTILSIAIVSVSSGIGNYIALHINDKLKKDIKYTASKGYTKKWEETINVKAFSKSKHDSRLIESFLKNTGNKYLKEVI